MENLKQFSIILSLNLGIARKREWLFLGADFKPGETGTCIDSACDGKLVWDDGSEFQWSKYSYYMKDVYFIATSNNQNINFVGDELEFSNHPYLLICGQKCSEVVQPDPQCYQLASFSTDNMKLTAQDNINVCESIGETLPMPKTGREVGELLTWIRRESGMKLENHYFP